MRIKKERKQLKFGKIAIYDFKTNYYSEVFVFKIFLFGVTVVSLHRQKNNNEVKLLF